ncbi:Kunitz inhibitor ST1-like [Vigna unguiculata]|uniref:Kunitz inhibitor ST1-like n=1 Tax=Vigna unguiculata TaxID=3917 RepID=A0A4D6ND08_VIGUN|nr:Kunitz inhibitor ST1-like [Vigna unguiculata]
MKFTILFSLFLFCGFTSYLPSATAIVVDTDGNLLRNGGTYFITPVIVTGNGGGVAFAATGNETCPLTVIQRQDVYKRQEEGRLVDIAFRFVAPCAATSSRWTAVKEGVEETLSIKLAGYDNPVPGRFKIKSVTVDIGGYNLLFCPDNGSSCGYVGIQIDATGTRRLVVTQSKKGALWIRFQRAIYALPATASAYASA